MLSLVGSSKTQGKSRSYRLYRPFPASIKYLSTFFSVRVLLNGHRPVRKGRRPSLCFSTNSTFWWMFRHFFATFLRCHNHNKKPVSYVNYLENTPILFPTVSDNNLISLLLYGYDHGKFDDTQNQKIIMSPMSINH